MDPAYAQQLHVLLEHCLSPDTATIKHATAELNTTFYKHPGCIPALFEIACSSGNAGVRQLAATELRKRVGARDGKSWMALSGEVRAGIKERLLERMMTEEIKIIRHSLARAVAAISDLELIAQPPQWPTLLPFLSQHAHSPNATAREISIFTLFTILDCIHDAFDLPGRQQGAGQNPFWELFGLFGQALGDAESEDVRVDALRALGKMAEYIGADQKDLVKQFQSLIPTMLKVLHEVVIADNNEGVKHAFDVFETLLLIEAPLLNKHVPEYVEACLVAAGNRDVEAENRCAALNSLSWVIQYKKGKIQSQGLAKGIIERLLPIGSEEDPEDDDEDAPGRLAFRALDELAKALPPTQVFPVLSPQLQQYMSSPNPMQRKAALMAFGVTVEGCSEFIRPHVAHLWPLIDSGLSDPEPVVRKAGCVALACLCEWLQDECAERHAQIVPVLFNLISDPATQKSATACLEAYLEILGDSIAQYLTLLMERLIVLLESAPDTVKATVTGAIGSAAFASKEGFKPYFEESIKRLVPFLRLETEGEAAALRSVATDTIGTFAEVVGKDVFRPYFADMMQHTIQALSVDNSRFRETSYMFFGTMAEVFEDEFSPYLGQVIPPLLASCMQSEANQFDDEDANGAPVTAQQAVAAFNAAASSSKVTMDGDAEDEEEDLDELDALFNNVNSEIAIEKEIACEVVGQIFEASKSAYLPYLDQTVEILIEKLEHYYEGIRKSALSSLFTIIKAYYLMAEPEEWQGKNPAPPLHDQVKLLIDTVMPKILEAWVNEDDKQVVISICTSLAEVINTVGPAFLDQQRQAAILSICKSLLEQNHDCQQDLDVEEENNDQSEYDSVVVSAATDVVAAIVNVRGAAFATEFAGFLPLIVKFYDPKRSNSERSMTVGSLGEIIVGLQNGITAFTEPILSVLARALGDESAEVRSNAAFASGAMIEWSDVNLTGQYVALLHALQPYFAFTAPAASKDELNARDNATGAVARMITKSSESLPLEQVLPMFIGALPLKNDTIENRAVFDAIFHLFEQRPDTVMPFVDQLLPVFAYVLDASRPDDLVDATRERLFQLVGALQQQMPDKTRAAGLAV